MRPPWDEAEWRRFEDGTRVLASGAHNERAGWLAAARRARRVLRTYSTSFFLVTRFLPPVKRAQVEAVYAAVRFPDEVVDSFPLPAAAQLEILNRWGAEYDAALRIETLRDRISAGIRPTVAAFAQVVRDCAIPPEHYHSFLDAMRRDASPKPFSSLQDLIDDYVYGSAIVVGYFLAYVYAATGTGKSAESHSGDFARSLTASRDLGIALQLTNFLRDVREDYRRGRVYLPTDMLSREGIEQLDFNNEEQLRSLRRVLQAVSLEAERGYRAAETQLDAFAPDCRVAIQACIDVYRLLNRQIGRSPEGVLHRESVPMRDKFRALPASKYWRLPMAYLGAI